jgi:hypothetical protein
MLHSSAFQPAALRRHDYSLIDIQDLLDRCRATRQEAQALRIEYASHVVARKRMCIEFLYGNNRTGQTTAE